MTKTLVIHPDDRSTDFLRPIYSNIPNVTIITKDVNLRELQAQIMAHDQIIMLGHGSPSGLFNVARIGYGGYTIGFSMVDYLRGKELIAIWCHANQFMERHQLSGLYSGMFISEVGEANFYNIKTTQAEVDESNDTFACVLGSQLSSQPARQVVWEGVRARYTDLAKSNIIADYNAHRWYCK
jgi:hypothetical protein